MDGQLALADDGWGECLWTARDLVGSTQSIVFLPEPAECLPIVRWLRAAAEVADRG
jgi:hypothetical protein